MERSQAVRCESSIYSSLIGLRPLIGPQIANIMNMRKLTYLFVALFALLACEEVKPLDENFKLEVTPLSLEFTSEEGTRSVDIMTDAGSWTVSLDPSSDWCKPVRTSGKTSTTLDIKVEANKGEARSAQLVFSAPGCKDVTVKVSQKGKTAADAAGSIAEGISMDPSVPDADSEAVLYFKAASDSPLYGYTGDVYVHIGVIVEGEWLFVPASKWEENLERCKMQNVAKNVWSLKFSPSIREWFGSGTTPVKQIGVVIRNSDGSQKGVASDTFLEIIDNVYKGEEFIPDPVVMEPLPSGMSYGINIGTDNSVTFVLYEKDTKGKYADYCYIVGDWNDWERVPEGAMKRDEAAGCWWITLSGFDVDKEYRFQYRLGNSTGTDIRVSDPYTEIVYDQWNDQYIPGTPAFPEKAKAHVSAFRINRPSYDWQIADYTVEDKHNLVIYEMLFRDFTATKDIAGAIAELDHISGLGVNAVELMPIQEFDGNISWGYNPNHYFALDKAYGTREQYKQFVDECHKRDLAVIVDVVYNHTYGSHPWAKMYWDSSNNRTASNNPWYNAVARHPYNVGHDFNHENEMVRQHVKRSLEYLLTEYNIDGFRFDLTKGFTQKNTGEATTDANVAAWGKYDQSRVDILTDYADHIWSVKDDAVVIFEHLSEDAEEKELAEHGIQLWRNVNYAYRTAAAGGNADFSRMYSDAPFGGFVGYMESHDEERLCYGMSSDVSSVTWGICGTITGWGAKPDIAMSADGPFFAAKGVAIGADDMFKIRGNSEWNDAYNYGSSSKGYKLPVGKGFELTLGSSSQDMAVPTAGTYDIYFSPEMGMLWLMNSGKRPSDSEVDVYDEDPLVTGLRRAGCNAAFFLTVPGPKMIWQFGEIGYDYSIEYNGRTGEKPVVTDKYMAVPERKALYDTYAGLIRFRNENPEFFKSDADFSWKVSTSSYPAKFITCSAAGKNFMVVGNFGKGKATIKVDAPSAGPWKSWFDGSDVYEGNGFDLDLMPGEFKLLVDF